jgi:hypothetical protein
MNYRCPNTAPTGMAVNEIEPDRRLALALKFLIVFASVAQSQGD